MTSSCLVPGPGTIRAEKYCLLECKSHTEEAVWSMEYGLVSLRIKVMLLGKSFAVSKNQGSVSQVSKGSDAIASRIKKIRKHS